MFGIDKKHLKSFDILWNWDFNIRKRLFCILIVIFCMSSCGWINKTMKVGKYESYSSFLQQVDKTVNSFDIVYGNAFVINGKLNRNIDEENLKNLLKIGDSIIDLEKEIEEAQGLSDSDPKFGKVDKYFNDYLRVVKEEKEKISQIVNYYKNNEYKKDNFKKAKELYIEYKEIKEKNKDTIFNFEEAFEELRVKIVTEEIENMKKNNDLAGAESSKFVMSSNDFLREVSKKYYENTPLKTQKGNFEKLFKLKNDFENASGNFEKIQKSEVEKNRYNYENYSKIQNYSKELIMIERKIMVKIQNKEDFYDEFEKFNNILEDVNQKYDKITIK